MYITTCRCGLLASIPNITEKISIVNKLFFFEQAVSYSFLILSYLILKVGFRCVIYQCPHFPFPPFQINLFTLYPQFSFFSFLFFHLFPSSILPFSSWSSFLSHGCFPFYAIPVFLFLFCPNFYSFSPNSPNSSMFSFQVFSFFLYPFPLSSPFPFFPLIYFSHRPLKCYSVWVR